MCASLVCDGLTGLPEAVTAVWPQTVVQTCVIHLLRNSFRYASKKDWPRLAKDLKPVYTAPTEAAALQRLADFADTWESRYPAIVKLWENSSGGNSSISGVSSGDSHGHLYDQRDRKPQRPVPPVGKSPRALPHRAGRPQASLPDHLQPRSHGPRPATLDQPLEGRTQRIRHHLRRTHPHQQVEGRYTVYLTDPANPDPDDSQPCVA